MHCDNCGLGQWDETLWQGPTIDQAIVPDAETEASIAQAGRPWWADIFTGIAQAGEEAVRQVTRPAYNPPQVYTPSQYPYPSQPPYTSAPTAPVYQQPSVLFPSSGGGSILPLVAIAGLGILLLARRR